MFDWRYAKIIDTTIISQEAQEFQYILSRHLIGQERAAKALAHSIDMYKSGLADPEQPIDTFLFMGPTGVGKTQAAEALSMALYGHKDALIKIDCGEMQEDHEKSKLVGAPPGYLGHRETRPLLSQAILDQYPISIVLFDEIEKASDALFNMLLGIMDKGQLSLGDNSKACFNRSIIILASNLGAREMAKKGIGFIQAEDDDQELYQIARQAAEHTFSPEFMNRIDKVIVFRRLNQQEILETCERELNKLGYRIINDVEIKFVLEWTLEAKYFLVREGTNNKYGARPLKRAVRRFVTYPLANIIRTAKINWGDVILIDYDLASNKLIFKQQPDGALINHPLSLDPDPPATPPDISKHKIHKVPKPHKKQ